MACSLPSVVTHAVRSKTRGRFTYLRELYGNLHRFTSIEDILLSTSRASYSPILGVVVSLELERGLRALATTGRATWNSCYLHQELCIESSQYHYCNKWNHSGWNSSSSRCCRRDQRSILVYTREAWTYVFESW